MNALELGFRAGLKLDHYYTIETHGSSSAKKALKWLVEKMLGKTELFTWAYAYVYTKGRLRNCCHSHSVDSRSL